MKALLASLALVFAPSAALAQYMYSQPTYSAPVYQPTPSYIPRSISNDAIPGQMNQMQNHMMQQQIRQNTYDIQQQRINNVYRNNY